MQVSQTIAGSFLALSTGFFFDCLLSHPVFAEEPLPQVERLKTSPVLRHLKPNPMPSPPRTQAEQTVAQMYLPEGFRAELVVAEPDVHQPVAFAWDERGRVWVVEAYSYPTKRPAGQGLDKIVIFEDREGDGKFETRKVFAEGLNLVSGLEVGYGGVWLGAAPELLFIPDRNHDDKPGGPPQVLLDGFGYQDTHECLNSLLWGPDGWLYGNQGVFNTAHIGKPGAPDGERVELRAGVWRYHPVRHEFEVFAHGGSNQWGLDYDEHGQLFMTHCRSYFGRGGITHVIQGGHYWNQANANYAPFIVAEPPSDFPGFRNYLLASARHDHGAGGAGERGTDAIYGGHSHVGTMIYLGDNWPDELRGHLFTHNLGGHQINHDINQREGSGFDIVHAERDMFFCTDPKYVAVDLQYGPDGAVYVIDWYDRQHCHNPNTEIWDRGNGRLYRLQFDATYKPLKVNLAELGDAELVELHGHRNEWFVRTARRVLHERALARRLESKSTAPLATMALNHKEPAQRLRALWTLHLSEEAWPDTAQKALADHDEFVRAWAVRLLTDGRQVSRSVSARLTKLAQSDPSPIVRLALASAGPRMPEVTAWELIGALAQHAEDRDDRNLPKLLWQGLAPRIPKDLTRAFALAAKTQLPQLAEWIHWYAATLEGDGLNHAVAALAKADGDTLRRRLAGLWLAMEPRANVPMPATWKEIAPQLYAAKDARIQRDTERVAAVFGDGSMFPRLRETLAKATADTPTRKHAFAVLSRAQDQAALPVFLRLLDDAAFRSPTINLLARFDAPEVAEALLSRFRHFSPPDRSAALNALTSRASFALALLDSVAAGRLKREDLTSFYIRQLTALKHAEVNQRVAATWGKLNQTPAEKQTQIARLEKVFNEAPLWAYDGGAGRQHFEKLCATCHVMQGEGTRVGPELTGAGKNGIRYFLENVIDPNAVIGADFQMTTLDLKKGDVISGLIVSETASALTVRTTTDQVVIPKSDIAERAKSELSLMPEGLLESLSDREQIELLKFLTSN
ncbi:MAG: dehydrogenase [Verrucomicrobia bacterium]|nr:dehydrogenase [Verrucomicrobiota bacterium]